MKKIKVIAIYVLDYIPCLFTTNICSSKHKKACQVMSSDFGIKIFWYKKKKKLEESI